MKNGIECFKCTLIVIVTRIKFLFNIDIGLVCL